MEILSRTFISTRLAKESQHLMSLEGVVLWIIEEKGYLVFDIIF